MADDLVGEDGDLVVVDPCPVDGEVGVVRDVELVVRVPYGPARRLLRPCAVRDV
jgi:hypothetical protein